MVDFDRPLPYVTAVSLGNHPCNRKTRELAVNFEVHFIKRRRTESVSKYMCHCANFLKLTRRKIAYAYYVSEAIRQSAIGISHVTFLGTS